MRRYRRITQYDLTLQSVCHVKLNLRDAGRVTPLRSLFVATLHDTSTGWRSTDWLPLTTTRAALTTSHRTRMIFRASWRALTLIAVIALNCLAPSIWANYLTSASHYRFTQVSLIR